MINRININLDFEKDRYIEFLNKNGLNFELSDEHYVLEEDSHIVATGSIKNNVIMLLAVSEEKREFGYLAQIITLLKERLFEKGYDTSFIFTKSMYIDQFNSLNFKLIANTGNTILLTDNLDDYNNFISGIKNSYDGAIVMNANPFTLGHRYLVEQAVKKCNNLVIFVVENDVSYFSFKDRFNMVQRGVEDLGVDVLSGGNYIISKMTFPTYFFKRKDELQKEYALLDGEIFFSKIAKDLSIQKRFVGSEPIDVSTNIYNEELKQISEKYGCELVIINRREVDGEIISASRVRELIKNHNKEYKKFLPKTTLDIISERNLK